MSRSLPVWLLALALAAFVGCGGGAATDSGAVADSGGEATTESGGDAATMPSGGSGMEGAGGSGMESAGSMEMESGAEMNAPSYDAAGSTDDPADAGYSPGYDSSGSTEDPADASYTPGYGSGGADIPGAGGSGGDAADMAAAYGANAESSAGGGQSPEEMAANYPGGANPGSGTDGADSSGGTSGGANPAGPSYPTGSNPAEAAGEIPGSSSGDSAYPGGGYPGGPGGSGGGEVQEKAPDGFDGKAQLAFRRGNEKDAMQYLYAHALTSDAGAESILPTIRWVGGLRQPKLAVRWGAGFVVTAPRNFDGDPKPVGSEQKIPTRGGNKGAAGGNEGYVGGGGAADYGTGEGTGGGAGGDNSLLAKGAGELGEKLAAAYTVRVMRGDFGEVIKKATAGGDAGNRGNAAGAGGPSYGAGASYGAAEGSGGPGGVPGGGGGAAASAAALTEVTQIMPGLAMLGIGTQKELIERARKEEIDAVVIIDVKLRVNTSNGLVTNESTLSLLDAKTQKKLHTTKKFNNITIQMARAEGKEDGVDKGLEGLFEAIDASYKMADLPAGLNAEVAAKRVAGLAGASHDNPLPILAEARMYHLKGLLEESQLFDAYEKLIGVDYGRMLSTGTEEDKKKSPRSVVTSKLAVMSAALHL